MKKRELVYTSFTTARSHREGADEILRSATCRTEVPPRMLAPIYLLVGFSVELYLKAFLADHGADRDALKRIGHDLSVALNEARRHGLVAPDNEAFEKIVGLIDPPHKSLSFRYMPPDATLTLPLTRQSIELMLLVLARLDAHLYEKLNIWGEFTRHHAESYAKEILADMRKAQPVEVPATRAGALA